MKSRQVTVAAIFQKNSKYAIFSFSYYIYFITLLTILVIMSCLVIFLNILLSQVVLSYNWEHKIYVSTTAGINDTICWTNGQHTPCATINQALKGLQHNSTVIYITPGIYILEYGNEEQLREKSQVAIINNVSDSQDEQQKVVIKCSLLAGLSFLWSDNITIKSFTLHGCGCIQLSQY